MTDFVITARDTSACDDVYVLDGDWTIDVKEPVGHWYVEENIAMPVYDRAPSRWKVWWTKFFLRWKWVPSLTK